MFITYNLWINYEITRGLTKEGLVFHVEDHPKH